MNAELLALLCCPETRQPLDLAPAAVLETLETRRRAGTLRNRAGRLIEEPITAGLVRADGRRFFLIDAEIPLLLSDEAIELDC